MNARAIIDLSLPDLALVYGLILLVAALARLRGIGQERDLLWSSLRMVVQLLAVGYVLHFVFTLESAAPVLLILAVMTAFSVQAVADRVKHRMPRFYRIVGSSILVGCGGATFFFCNAVIGLDPWYDPRYLIPLAGMIIGNSMTGAALAAERLAAEMRERRDEIEIALVGKYVKLHDAYLSVHEALKHAGVAAGTRVRVRWVDAEDMSYDEAVEELELADGVLVPGGFGSRGWEGKVLACRVARERGIPYLGICLGMHVAVSEFARHVVGLEGANSTEMDPETPYPVIDLLPEQKEIEELGGTMRAHLQALVRDGRARESADATHWTTA